MIKQSKTEVQQKMNKHSISKNVRGVIYAYLDLSTLMRQTSKLSKSEREFILHCKYLDQPRCLSINMDKTDDINLDELNYMLALCTSLQITISDLEDRCRQIVFQTILRNLQLNNKTAKLYSEHTRSYEYLLKLSIRNYLKHIDSAEFLMLDNEIAGGQNLKIMTRSLLNL